jgi:uncharacterized protein YbjQ (UPF0145 family)
MLVSTMNDLPGYAVTEVLGEVFGLTVRARNIGSQLGAQFKSLVGGELRGMTTALIESRNQVMERMVDEARAKGADAVLAMRFDTSEMGPNWTEICAYGTAVRINPL